MNEVYLYGASGHAKVIYDILLKSKSGIVKGFIDDNLNQKMFCHLPLYKPSDIDLSHKNLIISIGNNKTRKKITKLFDNSKFLKAIHPSSVISENVNIGEGTVIMANAIINFDVSIGKHCILNTSCSIDHDCVIDDFVHISPNASLAGDVKVGKGTHIGIGACVIQGITIGKNVTIGAGSVIIRDVPDNVIVVGNPGKMIKFKNDI